jgi:dsRNA-specific ribonuclease
MKAVIVFLIVGAAIHVGVWWMFRYFRSEDQQRSVRRSLVEDKAPVPPEPRLQVKPQEELQEYLRKQQQVLNTYGWVSRDEGKVRIPIERAMELVVERETSGGTKR